MKPAAQIDQGPAGGQEAFIIAKLRGAGISENQVDSAWRYHRRVEDRQPLSRTFSDLGLASEPEIAQWIAEFHGWAYLPPERLRVSGDAHRALPEVIARSRHALAIARNDRVLVVAVADPLVPQFVQVQHALAGGPVEWVVSPRADIDARIADAYSPRVQLGDNEMERFVEGMFREAAHERGLSDIHCIPEERSLEIKWRIDGDLITWRVIPADLKEAIAAQVKLSSTRGSDGRSRHGISSGGLDVANRLDPQDASTVRSYGSKRLSLRFSVIPAATGESIVIRLLDESAQVDSLESLGMLEDHALRFRSELGQPGGIVLIAGPTGHGKSTTLAAAVPWLGARSKRVLSVEDPVEYRLRNVTQVQVSPRMGFASALRAFLRHNPDVIIIGEIRDSETANLAIRLALTGHLVLTTVHATTAVQALTRLLNLGVDASLLAATVRIQLSQRLVKKVCESCRRPHQRADLLAQRYPFVTNTPLGQRHRGRKGFFEAGGGCPACNRTGFSGRVAIFEFRDPRSEIVELLLRHRGEFDARAAEQVFTRAMAGGDLEARSIREDGLLKASLGLTTPEEVMAATMD